MRLLFSEPIDPTFSKLSVSDADGNQVDIGDARVDALDDQQLVVSLPAGLASGIYTVTWRSMSTIDVHPDFGQYRLFVGVPVTMSDAATQPSVQSGSTPATTVARWWLYFSVSVFLGALVTWKLVFGPLLSSAHGELHRVALRRIHRLAALAGLFLLVGTLFAAVAQAAAAAGVPLELGIGNPVADLLTRGRYAGIWWPRFGISLLAVAIIVWRGPDRASSESAIAMVPAILLTNSLTSHGAALPGAVVLGVVLDWVHVLAAAVWVGGLASLVVIGALVIKRQPDVKDDLLGRIVGRFSRLAIVAAAALALSGIAQAAVEVGSWEGLFGTTYGQAVLLKALLLVAMLFIAGVNQWRASRTSANGHERSFLRGVRGELLLGVGALVIAAVLSGTTPARQTVPSESTLGQSALGRP